MWFFFFGNLFLSSVWHFAFNLHWNCILEKGSFIIIADTVVSSLISLCLSPSIQWILIALFFVITERLPKKSKFFLKKSVRLTWTLYISLAFSIAIQNLVLKCRRLKCIVLKNSVTFIFGWKSQTAKRHGSNLIYFPKFTTLHFVHKSCLNYNLKLLNTNVDMFVDYL